MDVLPEIDGHVVAHDVRDMADVDTARDEVGANESSAEKGIHSSALNLFRAKTTYMLISWFLNCSRIALRSPGARSLEYARATTGFLLASATRSAPSKNSKRRTRRVADSADFVNTSALATPRACTMWKRMSGFAADSHTSMCSYTYKSAFWLWLGLVRRRDDARSTSRAS